MAVEPMATIQQTILQTLAELVSINSVSTSSNAEIADYLTSRCETIGLSTRRVNYTDENGIEKTNLIALAGTDSADIELALVGHTDTVPFEQGWTDALNLTEVGGNLYGRGACDTKGFIAAALTAVESLHISRLRRPLALVFTADEEIGLRGAKYLADAKALRIRYCIVGEPTSLRPIRAGKGYSLAQVVVRGREAHSAYPALGASAILGAARLIRRIEAIAEDLKPERHSAFDPPFTTLNIGLIKGGTAKNVVPGECQFTLEWRSIPGQDSKRVLELVQTAMRNERSDDLQFEVTLDATRADTGFETPSNSELLRLLEELSGFKAGTVAFGTEAAQMNQLGAEAVVLGPGDIRVAHRTGEYVPIVELQRCQAILKEAITSLCGFR
ncbi:MAG: acetylornithine deacetylase [Pyrinomonadaceae bacterium]